MTAATWRAGAATDTGRQRDINEDRVFSDDTRGIFLVVDGLGGHAAGETAAQMAVDIISKILQATSVIDEPKVREAITTANNEIYKLAEAKPAFRGMACVLTLAVAQGDHFLVGHVGDSRMYLFWNGSLLKVTSDHSPVGELEDAGELTEDQAMHHPRRNEVFRDVGSYPHSPDDENFIEVKRVPFRPDASLLLCSDGLTDIVPAAVISRVIERYDGDAMKIAVLLIEAANSAGGRDNISAIFVPGPDFLGTQSAALSDGRSRHGTTRMRTATQVSTGRRGSFLRNLFLLLIGMLLGLAGWRAWDHYFAAPAPPPVAPQAAVHIPKEIPVDANDPQGIVKALAAALPGDAIAVPAGEYLGPLRLKEHVNIIAQAPRHVIVRSDAASSLDPGVAIVARGVQDARIKGLVITGDDTHPLRIGLLIGNSSIQAEDVEVSRATEAGVLIDGDSHPLIVGGSFHNNAGPGFYVRNKSAPRLVGNRIAENGLVKGSPHLGIEIDNDSLPQLQHNDILKNGLPAVFPPNLDQDIRNNNSVDAAPGAKPSVQPAHPQVKPVARPRAVSRPLTEA